MRQAGFLELAAEDHGWDRATRYVPELSVGLGDWSSPVRFVQRVREPWQGESKASSPQCAATGCGCAEFIWAMKWVMLRSKVLLEGFA